MCRRLVLALLFFVLPVQFVWAAAAPYCAHETRTAAAKHFGHHEHQHQHQAGDQTAAPADPSGDAPGVPHVDCESCQLSSGATLPATLDIVLSTPREALPSNHLPRFRSHTPAAPERPDIAHLTPAARFGGVVSGALSLV